MYAGSRKGLPGGACTRRPARRAGARGSWTRGPPDESGEDPARLRRDQEPRTIQRRAGRRDHAQARRQLGEPPGKRRPQQLLGREQATGPGHVRGRAGAERPLGRGRHRGGQLAGRRRPDRARRLVAVPGPTAWVVTAVALAVLALALFWYGDARVIVSDGWFQAGRARIEAEHVGEVAALDAEQTRLVAGRDADARAFLLLRPYLQRAVKVEVVDPADPTPYWLVSSRHPEALADALTALPRSS